MDKKNFSVTHPVLKKNNKRWYFEFRKVFPGGGQQRVKVYAGINFGKTDAEKQKIADGYLKEFPANYYRDYNNAQLKIIFPAVENFLLVKSWDWEGRSHETYSSRIHVFTDWWRLQRYGATPERATFHQAIAFMIYLRSQKKIGDTTWNAYRNTLHEMFAWLKVKQNPFTDVKIFRDTKVPKKIFTEAQRKMLWDDVELNHPGLSVYIGLIYWCFLRPPNEIRNLKIGDIDFEARTIFINRKSSKTKRRRLHRIPKVFYKYIEHLQALPADWYVISRELKPGPLQCARGLMLRHIRRLLDHHGFDHRYSGYSWRHGAAVELMKEHHDIHLLQQAMGHSTIQTTEIYVQNWDVMMDERLSDRKEM